MTIHDSDLVRPIPGAFATFQSRTDLYRNVPKRALDVVLVLLTLPVTVVSLGLFILVINALLFWLVTHWIEGFAVAGFWSAFLAALLYSIISWALSTLLLKDKDGNS